MNLPHILRSTTFAMTLLVGGAVLALLGAVLGVDDARWNVVLVVTGGVVVALGVTTLTAGRRSLAMRR